ncbi:Asp/Glu racemase [Ruegeria sp. 2012CJ41-6]|uniref:Asp/Glu racemase n=1 Tax=Ruegeria spongiae TaxID=2942209 RepID=A0ABT0PXR5_9RHOB|nr:Asp/Glu racemase [Ruegeria spongiae]MCL6282366.1 Asp/Glu racemase [Ruegeria spongiae]
MRFENRGLARIGVLVPYTNTNLEPDLMRMRVPGTTLHVQRMGGYDVDEIPGAEQMAGLGASDISHDLRMIAGVRPDIVLYGCTSATLTHGPEFDTNLANNISDMCGARCVTAAGALVEALQALGVRRVGFSSPYLGEINRQAVHFLQSQGIETMHCADIGRELGNYGQGELRPDDIHDLACRADHDQAAAIVLSCTDMRSVEVVDHVEATLGKPVVTSNQAMMFCLMRALGLPRHPMVPGRLFDCL